VPDEPINDEEPTGPLTVAEITDLLAKLAHVEGLTERQQTLLNAIVQMFKDVEEVSIPDVPAPDRLPFIAEFLPGKAQAVIDYASLDSDSESAPGKHAQIAQYITRSIHP
jgi:hypothetical protein